MSEQNTLKDDVKVSMLRMLAEDLDEIEDPLKRDKKIAEMIVLMDQYHSSGLFGLSALITSLKGDLLAKVTEIHIEIFGNGSIEKSLIYKMAQLEAAQKARLKKDEDDQDLKKVVRNTVIVLIIGALFSLILVNNGG